MHCSKTNQTFSVIVKTSPIIRLQLYYNHLLLQWSANSRLRWLATLSLYILSYTLVILTAPISFFFVLVRIPEYERAVVLGSTIDLVSFSSSWWFSNFIKCTLHPNVIKYPFKCWKITFARFLYNHGKVIVLYFQKYLPLTGCLGDTLSGQGWYKVHQEIASAGWLAGKRKRIMEFNKAWTPLSCQH